MISFEEFQKVDLRVAKIIKAEKIERTEKLLKLEVETGSGQKTRQIVAGIAQFYQPEDLAGREIVVVTNLESRTMFGLKNQGMLLTADDEGRPVLLKPDKEVLPGAKVR